MDIEEIRNGFPVTRNWIYMNHAGIAPISQSVYQAMDGMLLDVTRNGMANLPGWDDVCSRTRESAARLIGADASEIAFVKNTSEGILMAANGLTWRQGDNVVIPDRGFPANVYPWLNLRSQGVEVRRVPEIDGRIPLDDLLNAVDDRTRVLSVSSVEFASGSATTSGKSVDSAGRGASFSSWTSFRALGRCPWTWRMPKSTLFRPTLTNGFWGRKESASSIVHAAPVGAFEW